MPWTCSQCGAEAGFGGCSNPECKTSQNEGIEAMTKNETSEVTLCDSCHCMTKTIDGHCGKCGGEKDELEFEIHELRKDLKPMPRSLRICGVSYVKRSEILEMVKIHGGRCYETLLSEYSKIKEEESVGQLLIRLSRAIVADPNVIEVKDV